MEGTIVNPVNSVGICQQNHILYMFLLLSDDLFFWDLNFLYYGFYGFLFAGL